MAAFPVLPRIGVTAKHQPLLLEASKYYNVSKKVRRIDPNTGNPGDNWRVYWKCTDRDRCFGTGATDFHEPTGVHGVFAAAKAHAGDCHWTADTVVLFYYEKELMRRFSQDVNFTLSLHQHHAWATTQLQSFYPHLVAHFLTKQHFVSTASRIRLKRFPVVPSLEGLATLVVPERFSQTLIAPTSRFFQHMESVGAISFMVFGTNDCFKRLCEKRSAYMDGTFYTCPEPFYQLFIVHFLKGKRMVPALYCFFSSKQTPLYKRFFVWLVGEAVVRGHPVQWRKVRSDFENGLMSAILQLRLPAAGGVFDPALTIQHCFFHLTQAWFRKLCTMGFQSHYRVLHLGVHSVVKRCMALAFLPEDRIPAAFAVLIAAYNALPAVPAHLLVVNRPDLTPWFDYIRTNYISDTALVARRASWSVSDIDNHRTNNNLEGYHSKLKAIVKTHKPNMWRMIEHLQEDARENSAILEQLDNGVEVLRRNSTYDGINDSLRAFKHQYNDDPPLHDDNKYVVLCANCLKTF
jgi:hypothetical protein